MQNITISIGKAGIEFFIRTLLADRLIQRIAGLTPPDKTLNVGFLTVDGWSKAEGIVVQLTQGKLVNFTPVLESIAQQPGGVFMLTVHSDAFNAQYKWDETYGWISCSAVPEVGIVCEPEQQINDTYKFEPSFHELSVGIPLTFSFDNQNQVWTLVAAAAIPTPAVANPNIPSSSIVQNQDQSCFSSQVDAATASALSNLNFGQLINDLISGMFASIPGHGNLGNGIVYDFSMGDYGLHFPNNQGIQMGVKGGASYQGTDFPGTPPPALPLPLPPADNDTHHLNMYVGGYEVDALNWAFFKAGELNTVVNATDLPDPDVLKVKTYIDSVPALRPYQAFAMQAQISQNAAPVTTFQTVYELSTAVMAALQSQLPQTVYNLLSGLGGNNYVSKSDLETDLNEATINPAYFGTIEAAAKSAGMVVTHDINYTLEILNFQPEQPNIVFNIKRVDILGDLALGLGANQTQVMQFAFRHANWQATFVSSTVPNLNGAGFPSTWNVAGEPQYDTLLTKLGATGVPLPIMQDLQFDFANAQLSLQEGYISILANVLYQHS